MGWPLAAAALLTVGLGLAIVAGTQPAAAGAPSPTVANLPPAAPSQPATSSPRPTFAAEPIDVEVVTVPGSTARHPHYLVRRGDQVLLVDPAEREDLAPPSDAKPASLRY